MLESKVLISACGHDGPFGASGVKRLQALGLVPSVPGMGALDMNTAEDAVVNNTREVYPGMILCGMEVAELDCSPRMGPTFGAMLLSGQKAAYLALQALGMHAEAEASMGRIAAFVDASSKERHAKPAPATVVFPPAASSAKSATGANAEPVLRAPKQA